MQPRIYITLRKQALPANFVNAYEALAPDILDLYVDAGTADRFAVVGFPSLKFPSRHAGGSWDDPLRGLARLVVALEVDALEVLAQIAAADIPGFEAAGPDLAFGMSDHWCPGGPPDDVFATRAAANRLIRSEALRKAGLSGRQVNLVVVDHGLNEEAIGRLGGAFGGGWTHITLSPPSAHGKLVDPVIFEPGQLQVVEGVTDNGHGMMVARNVIGVAPGVTLHDCPLVPARITEIPMFLSDAEAAFNRILADVRESREVAQGDWILVNAWAIFDRSTFEVPLGGYTDNPAHPFNRLIDEMAREQIELVFAAGNSGQFCPDRRAGAYDIGPGHSIHGANGHPLVLTVGAVRADGIWLGSSSQGPGPEKLAAGRPGGRLKPDVCAPSEFTETADRHRRNGGTSAACALVAGVLAALREGYPTTDVPPDRMRQVLRDTAWRPANLPPWDERLGYGIINVEAVLAALP